VILALQDLGVSAFLHRKGATTMLAHIEIPFQIPVRISHDDNRISGNDVRHKVPVLGHARDGAHVLPRAGHDGLPIQTVKPGINIPSRRNGLGAS